MLVALGVFFIGLSLITVIGANWDSIPRGLRLTGMIALTAGTHALALRCYLSPRQSAGVALFMLGNIFYGASIILVAQVYHLGEHMPDGVFWWAIGSLPFALILGSTALAFFSGALALIWFALEYATGFFAIWFPVFIAAELYVLVRGRSSLPLFLLCVVSLLVWIEALLSLLWTEDWIRMELTPEHFFVSVALFVVAYAVSHWLQARNETKAKDYGLVLSLWIVRFVLIVLLVLSFEGPWATLIAAEWSHAHSMWAIVAALMAAALGIAAGAGTLPRTAARCALCGGIMAAVALTDDEAGAFYFQVLDNVALVAAGIWLIARGALAGASHYFFLGVTVILLTAFLRYVDLIGDYVGGALLFMLLAGLLLGSAWYWKRRQNPEQRA